jgi:thiamine monophosphate kinase
LASLPLQSGADPLYAMQSGEEYELLAAVPSDFPISRFRESFSTPLTVIGDVSAGVAAVRLMAKGESIALPSGHDHF